MSDKILPYHMDHVENLPRELFGRKGSWSSGAGVAKQLPIANLDCFHLRLVMDDMMMMSISVDTICSFVIGIISVDILSTTDSDRLVNPVIFNQINNISMI